MPMPTMPEEDFKKMIQYYVTQALAQPMEIQGIPCAISLVVVELIEPTEDAPFQFNVFNLEASTPTKQVESVLATLRVAMQNSIKEIPNAD